MKYNHIFIITFFWVMSSCSHEMIIGQLYNSKKSSHNFIFNMDSTFSYRYKNGCYKESSGHWFRKGNSVCLNTDVQLEKIPIEYKKRKGDSESLSVVNVTVNMPAEYIKDYICFPFVNKEVLVNYPERGSFSFRSKVPIDSIYFLVSKVPLLVQGPGIYGCFDDMKTERIYPKLFVGEDLDITINIVDSLFSYKVLKNKELQIKKRALIFKENKHRYKLTLK